MLTVAILFAAIAAAIHVYIFWLESFAWTAPRTRAIFGIRSEADALATRSLAYNQGFYNLFLALLTVGGIGGLLAGADAVGATLVFAGTGCMVAAAGVLLTTSRSYVRAATVQGAAPAIAIVTLALALAS